MNREFQKLLFEGILDPDVLEKLGNIDDFDDVVLLQEEEKSPAESQQRVRHQNGGVANGKHKKARSRTHSDQDHEDSKEDRAMRQRMERPQSRKSSRDSSLSEEDGAGPRSDDDLGVSEDDDEELQRSSMAQEDSYSQSQHQLLQTPDTAAKKRAKVSFLDTPLSSRPQMRHYRGIDLSVLYKTRNEMLYRLTELYLPKSQTQKQKMLDYNYERMKNQNDQENQQIREHKRKAKEDLKSANAKLKYQIKYGLNPGLLMDDAYYFYNPGMTSRQLDQMRSAANKYSNASHIGKILPQKRSVTQTQTATMERALEKSRLTQEEEPKLKSYIIEYDTTTTAGESLKLSSVIGDALLYNEDTSSSTQDSQKEKAVDPFKQVEAKYLEACLKIQEEGLSLADMSQELREAVKAYLKTQVNNQVIERYPVTKLSAIEKKCYMFMKHLDQVDFSYKGLKSAVQSEDASIFFDDFLGGSAQNHGAPQGSNNIFGVSNQLTSCDISADYPAVGSYFNNQHLNTIDKTSVHSGEFGAKSKANDNNQTVSDYKLQEWFIEQKFVLMQSIATQNKQPIKRRKYWGEPTDCSSKYQVQKDNFTYKRFLTRQNQGAYNRDIFKLEIESKTQKGGGTQADKAKFLQKDEFTIGLQQFEDHQPTSQIKDFKEYEYFKQQKRYFYQDQEQKVSLNSIMRGIHFELGIITEEEFYAQEALEDQLESQSNQGNYPYKGGLSRDQAKDRQHELELRKDKICNEVIDNFDIHFEKRRKELHDNLLKKIQLQEKANQQSTSNQQTVIAYSSGSHALLQASGAMESKQDSLRDKLKHMHLGMSGSLQADQDFGMLGQPQMGGGNHPDDENQDENALAMMNQKAYENDAVARVEGEGGRVTKTISNQINHAKCIMKLTFANFDWSERALLSFHRPNIQDEYDMMLHQAEMEMQEKIRLSTQNTGSIIIKKNGEFSMREKKNEDIPYPNKVDYIATNVKVMTNEYIEKRARKIGIINAHDYFKDRFKLSLKDGKFCIFEHIDQHPLFINNFGMASKLKRYVYSDKPLPHNAFVKRSENQFTRHMGPHGAQILKKKGEKIPLLGQIDNKHLKGLTVFENNMYICPVFYHKPQRSDFLCIFHRDKNGKPQIIVRELSEMYAMGQEEPKMEIYNPQSRNYQHFIKRRTQAYVIRFLQENNNYISFTELNKYFPYINDQILKKIIKEIYVEVDRNQYCSLSQDYNDEQFKVLITPENICQYESAQFGEQMLKNVGIRDITNADKVSYATNKFCSEEPNLKKQQIARIIEEIVLSTPWNLSQNFLHNKASKGMMMLEGYGDPSNGHGGYSYLKLPLKISQDSLNKAKINRMYLNPAIQNPKAVTGTDADLRKLSKKEIRNKLIDLGFKEEQIAAFTRWEMVALLRDRSSQAVSQGLEGDMKKFARGVRFTSKKQREMYQKQVNDIFKKQILYLSKETGDFIQDVSDTESRDKQYRRVSDMQQSGVSTGKNVVEMDKDIDVKNIKDIPGFEILLMANQPPVPASTQSLTQGSLNIGGNSGFGALGAQGSSQAASGYDLGSNIDREAAKKALEQRLNEGMASLKCTILRKKIKPVNCNDQDKMERVIFCSDPRQIKNFNKRKHKHEVKTRRTKKTSLKEKMQTSKPIIDDLKERTGGTGLWPSAKSESSSVFRQGPSHSVTLHGLGSSHQTVGESVKIKIGAQMMQSDRGASVIDDSYKSSKHPQSISINLQQQPQPPKKSYQRFQSQVNFSSMPFDQLTSEAQPAKISINIPIGNAAPRQQDATGDKKNTIQLPFRGGNSGLGTNGGGTISMNTSLQISDKKKQQKPPKKAKESQQTLKFSSAAYNDDDSEIFKQYKPPSSSRRRQLSGETCLNELFVNIIDSCLAFDTTKMFHQPVKKKEAPNYFDVIKNPIDLTSIKSKARRQEYKSQSQFREDIELLRMNAQTYNGPVSPITAQAIQIEQHALQMLNDVQSDITSFECIIRDQINQ